MSTSAPNMRMQPDAASRPRDHADFGSIFGSITFSIYRGGAADARGVGALTIRMDRQM
jgi:hypothetical protein